MNVKFTLNDRAVPDGTILLFGIRYDPGPESAGSPTTYTYAALKAGGLWYLTGGSGRVPTAAGWGAVARWLEREGRTVEYVELVTGQRRVWPLPASPEGEGTSGQPAKV